MTLKSKPHHKRALRLVSLYTGAGGLDFGFEAAGFETCVALEMDADSCDTIRKNRTWPIIQRDISQTPSHEILDVAGLKAGEADVLIGGPPCQPFSKSAYWSNGDTRRLNDPRASTLHEYMRCVEELLPKVFLLENVHGINYCGKEEGFHLLSKITEEINRKHKTRYTLSWKVLNSAHYGVPQIRQRFFLVASRDGQVFRFPDETHGELEDRGQTSFTMGNRYPLVTAWDAIGHIAQQADEDLQPKGYWADLLPSIPEGENYLWHTNRKGGLPLFGWRTRYWSFLLKLSKQLPSWTIQAQPGPAIGPFHWKNRRLSVKEMAAIQTFPGDITFAGSRVSIQRQIGNAVPSLLAEVLAREIRRQILKYSCESVLRPKLSIELNRPIPPAERTQKVAKKYVHHIGNHPDHD